jgi:hypothetical protein
MGRNEPIGAAKAAKGMAGRSMAGAAASGSSRLAALPQAAINKEGPEQRAFQFLPGRHASSGRESLQPYKAWWTARASCSMV